MFDLKQKPRRRVNLNPRLGVLMAVLLLALAGCKPSQRDTAKDDTTGDRASASPSADSRAISGPLNVLFVTVDTTRADCLGCYGHEQVKTPHIDRLAAEGVRFAVCISSAPLTFPSHSTMMTGSYPFVHGARDNGIYELSAGNVTLAEIFRDAGYSTHAEVSAVVLDKRHKLDQGFDTYGQVDASNKVSLAPPPRTQTNQNRDQALPVILEAPEVEFERKADEITDAGIKLLRDCAQSGRPFFIWLHYFDPHWPHEAPEYFAKQYPTEPYFAEIAYFDQEFGRIMDFVRSLDASDQTLVILTSDHGEGRGQHGEFTHSTFLYDTTLHVPLILWAPARLKPGLVIESQVRSVDLAPTILDMANLETTPQMQGVSLVPLMDGTVKDKKLPCYSDTIVPANMYNYAPLRSLRTDEWKYIHAPKPELYDLKEDPFEVFNLAEIEPQKTAGMRNELRDLIENSPPAPDGRASRQTADSDTLAALQALGYAGTALAPEDDPMAAGTELDHFEPVGRNPKDHVEEVDCLAKGMGFYRLGDYAEAEKAFNRLLELDPDNPKGISFLGALYVAVGRLDEALALFRRAVELTPSSYEDHRSLGMLLLARGEYEESEIAFKKTLDYKPDDWRAHMLLARLYTDTGRIPEAEIEIAAAEVSAPNNSRVLVQKAFLLRVKNQPHEAIVALRDAVAADPFHVDAIFQLAWMLSFTNLLDEAIALYDRLMAMQVPYPPAYVHAAVAYDRKGDRTAAIDVLRKGRKTSPDNPRIANDLAWRLATSTDDDLRNGQEALEHALFASAATGAEGCNELDTLAAAYAEAGHFQKAVEAATRAIEIAHQTRQPELAKRISDRLELYKQSKPYRSN